MEIQGTVETLKILEKFPYNIDKVIKSSMRKAGISVSKQIKAGMPRKEYKKLVKVKISGKNSISVKVGLFGTKSLATGEISTWFKAYWSNYGTLENRDKTHKFEASRRRSRVKRGGIRPRNFFENSILGVDSIFSSILEEEMIKQTDLLYDSK